MAGAANSFAPAACSRDNGSPPVGPDVARACGFARERTLLAPLPATQWIKDSNRMAGLSSGGGKHQVKMTKPGCLPIALPENKRRVYPKGFEAELRRQAGLRAARTDPISMIMRRCSSRSL